MTETKLSGFKELMRAQAERETKLTTLVVDSTSNTLVESTTQDENKSEFLLSDWAEGENEDQLVDFVKQELVESTNQDLIESTSQLLKESTLRDESLSTTSNLVDSFVESTSHPKSKLVDSTTPPISAKGVHQKKVVDSRKTDRHNKNKTRIQPRIDKRILRRIKSFCVQTGIELGEYIERLALHHLELVDSTKEKRETPQIDKMITFRSCPSIINLYERLTKNRWTWRDDKEASPYSEPDTNSIEIAMIRTLMRAKEKIGSFKYFIPEIEKELAMNFKPETKIVMLASAREALNAKRMGFEIDA